VLKGVVAQQLLPRRDGEGQVAAREIMIINPAISNLIRQGKTHEIYASIEMGSSQGMIGMERAIIELAKQNLIDYAQLQNQKNPLEVPIPRRRASDHLGPAAA
jgi:twitching motility protein PilT